VAVFIRCSSWWGPDDAGGVVEFPSGFASEGRGDADTISPDVDRAVEQRRPPGAAGVVGQLLVDHAVDDRGPDIEVGLVGYAKPV
jgi:hypothetical protein